MTISRLTTLALLTFAPATLLAQGSAGERLRLDFTEETLDNGLRVIYHVDRSAPVAAVVVWYDVASKHEQPGRTGFAHLFEHLMLFTGSKNAPEGQAWALLEAAGGRAGADLNGTTSNDRTNYFSQVPSNALDLALWLEADRMGTLDEALNQVKLDNQREVVKNERRSSIDNQPYGTWFEKMQAHHFPEGHPYRHSVIGSLDDLSNATLDDVLDFFHTYYVPNNAVLVVAGDIDLEEARRRVRLYFGGIPRGNPPPPMRDATVPPIRGAAVREVVEDDNAPAPAVYFGFRMPNARDPRSQQVRALGNLLGSGRSSPLYEELVRNQQIATSVSGFNFGFVDGADLLVIAVTGRPGVDPDELERAALAELERVPELIDEDGLRRVQAAARFGLLNQLQSLGGFGGRGDVLAEGKTIYGDAGWINGRLDALDSVTVAALRGLAAERMVRENRVTLVYVPRRTATGAP